MDKHTVLANEALIVDSTDTAIEIDISDNKRGSKTKFAWFTEDPSLFCYNINQKHT
jgi:hypothetical protein